MPKRRTDYLKWDSANDVGYRKGEREDWETARNEEQIAHEQATPRTKRRRHDKSNHWWFR
jgi:hypothetical protein